MSSKPQSRSTPEPPNLRSDLAERSDVKVLLAELRHGLKEGEDPLFYELPREAPDPACVGAAAARVYVAPREVPGVARPVVETAKVSLRSGVNAERAVADARALRRVRGAWILAAALGLVTGGVVVMALRSAAARGREVAEAASMARVSGGASATVKATAVSASADVAPMTSASVSAMPMVSAAPMPAPLMNRRPSSAPTASGTAAPMRKAGQRGVEDPYDAAPLPGAGTKVPSAPAPAATIPPELLN